jgi:2-(1,2-epoxy-1,2-dihydrophenyl)acetyl-CoA isomerase
MFKQINFVKQSAIARIELNRPDEANGLDSLMASELKQAAQLCSLDADLKVVILNASGRFFCAGGDIKEMASQGDATGEAVKSLADDLHDAISLLCRMDAVLIVAVNGVAAGAGFSIALIGDIVLASESATFTMAYTRAGLSPDGSSSYFLPRLVGLRKAQELMLLNHKLSAQQALELGLVTRVVADDSLQQQAELVAQEFVAGSKASAANVKKLLMSSFERDLETQMEIEGELVSQCASSKDGREGIQAFVDKRQPEFE